MTITEGDVTWPPTSAAPANGAIINAAEISGAIGDRRDLLTRSAVRGQSSIPQGGGYAREIWLRKKTAAPQTRRARRAAERRIRSGRRFDSDQRAVLRFDRCEEIDSPNANAFWRVAPDVLFNARAIFTTGVF